MKKQSLLDSVKATEAPASRPESCERIEKADDVSLVYYGEEIKTVEQLLRHAQIDMTLWAIESQVINNWEVAGKRKMGGTGTSRNADTLWKTGLRQIRVKLRRLAPKPIQEGIRELLKNVKPIATAKPPKRKPAGRHMLECGLYDAHFGKLCWGEGTGTQYDLKIADREYRSGIDEMIGRAVGFNVNQIVLPVGNDFFHVNDWMSQTANLTRVESVDDRFEKVFRAGCRAVQYAVERCLEVAPVKVIFVPGNHDRHTSWFMTEWLTAAFGGNKSVEIDNGPRERKYHAYGVSLLGYVHGDEIKPADLPNLMAVESPAMWAASKFRSWRIGHFHRRKETRYNAGDTFQGVEVRVFPSLCGTDQWHFRKGFIGASRMAECHLWSESDGPVGHFIVHAKEPLVPLNA